MAEVITEGCKMAMYCLVEMLVIIQYSVPVLVVRSGYPGNVVVYSKGQHVQSDEDVCRCCMNPVIDTGFTSVDIGGDANLELVDKFCYLGDMLSVDGDADAAVEARI